MTIIEFFERESNVENIISTLLCAPDKVIFLGDNKKRMVRVCENYKKVAQARNINVEFDSKAINRNNLMSIVDTIEEIISTNEDCIIDLSGGDDLALVAIGIVYSDNADNIKLHRFSITNSTMYDCDSDGKLCATAPLELTVEELVAINGGRVIYTDEKPNATYRWNFTEEFVDDIYLMWSVCRQDPHKWNSQIGLLNKIIASSENSDTLDVRIEADKTAALFNPMTEGKKIDINMFRKLGELGILTDFKADTENISFRFKNHQIKKCLTKAGQVLELYLTVRASELEDDEGNPLYTDALCGVFIDWDGEIHQGTKTDVENEIDLILMKGLMPVFISCKNGAVDINELFKLSVVADKFGGKYVRKVLAATQIDKCEDKTEYIRLRADAVGVNPWIGIHKKTEKDFISDLSNLWCTK